MDEKKVNVGFRMNGIDLLGFEVKISLNGDVYMLIFERGHRRLHVSYHASGRINYRADCPNAPSVPVKWDFPTGKMEPMIKRCVPSKQVVGREKVGVTGWGTEDIDKAGLRPFTPSSEDILIEPSTLTVGFLVNIIGPHAVARDICEGNPVLQRHYIHGAVTVEIEVFDWASDETQRPFPVDN